MIQWTNGGVVALVLLGLLSGGCSKPWQQARTVVTIGAEAVDSAQEAIAVQYEESPCAATEDPEELGVCVERLRELVGHIDVARAALLEGEAIVDVWETAQSEPENWHGWAGSVGRVLARLVELLDAAGVDVPEELVEVAAMVDSVLEGVAP